MNYNKVIMCGRTVRELESRFATTGTQIVSGTLALSEKRGDKEEKAFVDFVAFGKTAEVMAQYSSEKGSEMLIEGKIAQDNWEDKQTGQKRSKLKVVVDRVKFGQKPQERPQQQRQQPRQQPHQEQGYLPGEDDLVP